MSTCISKHGEFSEHEPGDWCPRCWAFNEEAIVAERDELRRTVGESVAIAENAIAERNATARLLAAESARVGEAEGGMRILAAVLDQACADLRKVTAERDALAAKLDAVRALPVGPPSGGYYIVSMRDVLDALDANGGE